MKLIINMAVAFFLLTGPALTAVKNMTASRTSAAPIIDGKLDEGDWKQAHYIDQFTIYLTTNSASSPTAAAALYDEDNLYVGIICTATNPVQAKIRGREEDIFQDDEIEVMIDPCLALS